MGDHCIEQHGPERQGGKAVDEEVAKDEQCYISCCAGLREGRVPGCLLLTSSGTEKLSLDVEGLWTSEPGKGKDMVTSCFLSQCFD